MKLNCSNHYYSLLASWVLALVAATAYGDLIWTGAGDGVSLYQEANWVDTATAQPPGAGAIDANVAVNNAVIATNGTPGGPGGAGAHLRLGTGSLSVTGNAVFRMSPGGGAGIRVDGSNAGNNFAPVTVTGNAHLLAQFFSKLTVTLGDTAQISLYGGGNPINNSTIDITSTQAALNLLAESPSAFLSEHLSKITVNGLPAVTGADPAVFEPGDNLTVVANGGGSVVQAAGEVILIESFSASPEAIQPGGTATLSWAVNEPFATITIRPEPGDVSGRTTGGVGSLEVSPHQTTIYTLAVTREGFTDVAVATVAVAGPADVRLNEVMAVNNSTLADEDDDFSDWIELINRGGTTADLSHWFLTDNSANLTKWQFPAGIMLAPGEIRVVFASGKNRTNPTNTLHTNFRLTGGGEFLALVQADGTNLVDAFDPQFPPLPGDVSYGLSRGSDTRVYFTSPTPGLPNLTGDTNLGPVIRELAPSAPRPNRSLENGPLDDTLVVTVRVSPTVGAITNVTLIYRFQFDPEAMVRMMDDGAGADAVAGDGRFTGVIPLAGLAAGQMVRWRVRAQDAAGHESWQPEIPAPNPAPKEGTPEYVGTVAQLPAGASDLPVFHWFVQNPAAAGTRAGTQSSVFYQGEFYDNIFTRVRGGTTTSLAKKSYKFDFNRGYRFRFDPAYKRVSEINLNTTYTDKSFVRMDLSFEVYDWSGTPGCLAFPLRLQTNGVFHSIAMFIEQPNDDLLEREGLNRDGALYKMYNTFTSGTSGVEKKNRKQEGNADLVSFVSNINNLSGAALERYIFDHINVPAVLNYLAATVLTQNNDNMGKNYFVYRDTGGSGEWLVLPWDVDLTFGHHFMTRDSILNDAIWADQDYVLGGSAHNVPISPSHPFVGTQQYPGNRSWNRLTDALLSVDRFKDMYRRRLRTLMDSILQPPGTPASERLLENWLDAAAGQIGADAARDNANWPYNYGQPYTMQEAMDRLKSLYLDVRRPHLFVTHLAANAAAYAIPNAESARLPDAQAARPNLEFGLVEFNPASGNQDEEFVQLLNPNAAAVDLSGWALDGAVTYTFAPGVVILPGEDLYVSPNVTAFRSRAISPRGNEGHFVQGNYQGQLSARGETIRLLNPAGQIVSTLTYPGQPSPAQQFLRITEIMYHPTPLPGNPNDAQSFEFVELKNTSPNTALDLTGVHFADGIFFDFGGSSVTNLAPGETVVVVKNLAAFAARYGSRLTVAGAFTGALENRGERLRLLDAANEEILDFRYDNAWYPITDGLGFSLVVADELAEPDAWNRKVQWRSSGQLHGTPDAGEPATPGFAPILITEALTHTELPTLVDTIELYNPNPDAVDLGGWWLTDDFFAPNKYRIPDHTILAAGSYLTFDETQFNPAPGILPGFALSSDGDEVYLFSAATNGVLTGYVHGFAFGAIEDGVTFGRHVTSLGEEHFVPQTSPTLGTTNSGPRVGPVVISELMYHPITTDTNAVAENEYIELTNISTNLVGLFDELAPSNTWRLAGGVDYAFPTNTSLAPDETVLVVGFDPTNSPLLAAFRARYGLNEQVPVFGPYAGGLNNAADVVALRKPILIRQTNVAWVTMEEIAYTDQPPWPPVADGLGASLRRVNLADYGNDPINWTAALPSPGLDVPAGEPPEILLQPQSKSVAGNHILSLDVQARGTAPLLYQWFLNGVALPEATNALLWITNVQPAQAGDYQVSVLNAAGAVLSSTATVTVLLPPEIRQQPADVRLYIQPDPLAAPSTNATFRVVAGPAPLRFQWKFNGVDIPNATNSALTIVDVQTNDWGEYTVTVANDVTSLTSDPAWLIPLVRPEFIEFPLNQRVAVGEQVTLSAAVSGWPPPFRFEWRLLATIMATFEQNDLQTFYTYTAPATETVQRYRVIVYNPAQPGGKAMPFFSSITTLADSDGDGLPDEWEGAEDIVPNEDRDRDGMSNGEEYRAGTSITNALSRLALDAFTSTVANGIAFTFEAVSNKTYSVQFAEKLGSDAGNWQNWRQFVARPTNRIEEVTAPANAIHRFYRLVTPAQPSVP